ncbi:MAG: histidinol-phosphate transaminase [Pseudomonadota bacterium]|nr:histidinol-phosphate transaminase [Pseudomonadota bacterium]
MTRLQPRPGITDIAPYVPGASAVAGRKNIIKLSSNEGALGPSPRAIAAYQGVSDALHRYPDGDCGDLRTTIGERHNLNPDRIVCGAGSDELLSLLAKAYAGPGDEILFGEHAFVMYPLFAQAVGATPVKAQEINYTISVDALLEKVSSRTRILYIANPNNPTGTMITNDEMVRLRSELREDILLVIDSAYAEYVTRNDYSPGVELVNTHENVVMTRTFSKIYALGGVRLGWAYSPISISDVLNKIRPPFNVTSGAQVAGIAALNDIEFLTRSRDHNTAWQPWLTEQLTAIGLTVVPGVGNFALALFPEDGVHTANLAMKYLPSQGIIPRGTKSAGIPNGVRITIGVEAEMRATVEAIQNYMGR